MIYRNFHDAGFRFFGIKGLDETGTVCECGKKECAYKHPWFSSWQHTPEWSEEQLEVMQEAGQLDHGYGVIVSGLIVIDVDARNGGVESYQRLLDDIPQVAGAGLIVETGSGGGSKHLYFRAPDGVGLLQHHDKYPGIDFKSTGFVIGPGSKHISGNRYRLLVGDPSDIGPAPRALIDLLKKPDTYRAAYDGGNIDLSDADISDMLSYISPDCDHETWIKAGMAIHHATSGSGLALWDGWSSQGKKYPGYEKIERRWHSFGKSSNPVTIGTLIHYARRAGWRQAVTFECEDTFDYEESNDDLPFSIDGVDLTSPPGFVGEVARWIEDQSRRPRRHLAVAGALTAIGNIAGLRYTDDRDGVTTNLFSFCVAGSRTGKEAIQQAVASILRVAGMAPATHGAIKSEQEIVRNLIRHQAALYIIDEIGIFLQKVKNAQTKGGASYLDGVIGMLMGAYSKADGFMLLTGDARDEMQQILLKEAAQINRKLENLEGDEDALRKKLDRIDKALDSLNSGLDRPFLSLIGFTTPVTFDDLVDYQSATNGFIGRALIFNERETAPRSKRRFSRRPMSPRMESTLMQIYSAGEFDSKGNDRVEYYGERLEIVTDDKAHDMLDAALDWLEDQAEAHKGVTGLEALYLGAYELVSKVSLILACPEGVRTAEHVRWAFALVRSDIEGKARLVTANDRQEDAPDLSLRARIANIIDGDGEKRSVIHNRLRRVERKKIDEMLEKMVEDGIVEMAELQHPKNGKKFEIYRLSSQA